MDLLFPGNNIRDTNEWHVQLNKGMSYRGYPSEFDAKLEYDI